MEGMKMARQSKGNSLALGGAGGLAPLHPLSALSKPIKN